MVRRLSNLARHKAATKKDLQSCAHGARTLRRKTLKRAHCSFLAAWLLLPATVLLAASPRLTRILPRGVQRGAEHVLVFHGSHLGDAQEIFFYDAGFEVLKVEPDKENAVRATVRVAPDCRLGEHVAQVRTATGISDFRTLYVGALAAVAEAEPNSQFESPQSIPMNVTVQGVIQNEDVDYYAVDAKKGARLAVEVEGMRLGTERFDPYVAVLNNKRFELASADDTPLVYQDCVAVIVVPEDGRYVIEVRESAYGGNDNSHYRLHVGTFPRPTGVYPAGGPPGKEIEVRYVGDPAGDLIQTLTLPDRPADPFGVFAHDAGGMAPSPNPFRLVEYENVLEKEPNNGLPEATAAVVPRALNGIISAAGDVDCFRFAAKKGQVFDLECYARRIRSPLDPVLNLYDAAGKSLAGNDDSRGPDSYLRFTIPADGSYTVRVADHLSRGGPDFVYRVEVAPVKPELSISIPRVERYGQYRQTISVPRGNRFTALVTASRANFGGELVLEDADLPQGLTITAEPMPANMNVMPVAFEAAADAPIGGKLIDFAAHHADPKQAIRGGFRNVADLIIGPPNQSIYRRCAIEQLAVAVVEPAPFKLQIVEPRVPLVRNGSMGLKIVAQRDDGFKAPINIQFPFRPPGVGAASSVTLPAGQNEVVYPLNANGGAQVKQWHVFALGSAEVNGAAWVSSQLARLEVAEPYVTVEMQRAACEQGAQVEVLCKFHQQRPFPGTAKAQLLGLPAKVTAADLEFTAETQEAIFAIKTDAASPAGKHGGIFCQVTITDQGEPITSRAGGTELQIDKPLPAPQKPPPTVAKVAPAQAKPAKTKPLSRLQKLRLEAKKRAAG